MGHPIAFELITYIAHTIFNDLAPNTIVLIVQRQYLIFEDLIDLFQIVIVLLLNVHVLVIGLRHNKSIVPMIDELRDPSVVGR